jgi:hypothetical protein
MVCQIITTVRLYDLLKPVNRSVSLLAAVLGLMGCGIKTFSRLFYFAPLLILGGTHYLSVFSGEQLSAMALLFLRVNDIGAGIALVFFGFYAVLKGLVWQRRRSGDDLRVPGSEMPRIAPRRGSRGGSSCNFCLRLPYSVVK